MEVREESEAVMPWYIWLVIAVIIGGAIATAWAACIVSAWAEEVERREAVKREGMQ